MRGAPKAICGAGAPAGLIPARAGSTFRRSDSSSPNRAHPRPCGEHTPAAARIERPTGSSPPVRGAHKIGCTLEKCRGLIPARAGSTIATKFRHWDSRAHPRPCGEHVDDLLFVVVVPGSSPPVRGAPAFALWGLLNSGLIPARAGSTGYAAAANASSGAHPRPCGEHSKITDHSFEKLGSSPPVRGAPQLRHPRGTPRGLIPARAGSTRLVLLRLVAVRAHPRPCGEHTKSLAPARKSVGSSPPVRGAHLLTWGFIPYTGKIGLLWSQSLRPEYTINNCS